VKLDIGSSLGWDIATLLNLAGALLGKCAGEAGKMSMRAAPECSEICALDDESGSRG